MDKLLRLFTILTLFLFYSCSDSQENIYKLELQKMNKNYTLWKSEFPDSLTAHFPEQMDTNFISYGSSYRNTPKEILYLSLEKRITEKEKEKFKNLTPAKDSCIIRIYANKYTYGFDKRGLGNCISYIPVPDLKLVSVLNPVPDDYKYYLIELSHQTFINHKMYFRNYLPDEWKNGMSRGIGISEKENIILYWLIMW